MSDAWMTDAVTEDAKEWELLREPQEVDLEVINTKAAPPEKVADNKLWIQVTFRILGMDGFFRSIFHYVNYPNGTEDSDGTNAKKLRVNEFYDAIGLEPEQRNPGMHEAWRSRTCKAIIGLEPDTGFGEKNSISKFVL